MGTVRVSDQVEWRAIDAEVIVLDLRSELYLSLNETGAFLWRSIAEGASSDELVGRLVAAFDVDEAVAEKDVADFLSQLAERGLVRHADPDLDPTD